MSKESKKEGDIERSIDHKTKMKQVKMQLGVYKEALEIIKEAPDLDQERLEDAEVLSELLTERLKNLVSKSDRQYAQGLMREIDKAFPEIKQAVSISTLPKSSLLFTKKPIESSLHEPTKSPETPPETSPRDDSGDSELSSSSGKKQGTRKG